MRLRPRSSIARRLAICTTLALACGAPASALAQDTPGCPSAITEWVAACDAGPEPVRVAECPPGHAILVVGPGRLRVDVTRRSEGAFASAGPLGASPVGEFADWEGVPRADRDAFDALVRCMRARPGTFVDELTAVPSPPHTRPRGRTGDGALPPLPWRALLGALAALALLVRRFGARGLAERAMPLVALGAVVIAARHLLIAESYFHQNGQGPLWIRYALGESSPYGSGYAQLFHWAARHADDPDGAVFFVQSALAALVPPAVVAFARGASAPRPIAWALGIAVALSPFLARIARSESYFATCGALLAIAAAILSVCARPEDRAREQVAAASAAGLVVAQAAMVHPIGWLAAALVPSIVLVGAGAMRPRLRLFAICTLVIAAIVLLTAGTDMLAVLRGSLGAQWLGPAASGGGRHVPIGITVACVLALTGVAIAAGSSRWRRAGVAIAVSCVAVVIAWRGELVGAAPPWIRHAYGWLYLAPPIAALAALAVELEGAVKADAAKQRVRWIAAGVLVALALAWHGITFDDAMRVPTDAREAALVRSWRARLPEGAVVVHLERAGRQIVALPLYDGRDVRLGADQPVPDLTTIGRDVYVYRSGLCTTERGRELCAALDAAYELAPLRTAVLPAVPSMAGLDYDRRRVAVGLYRVRDRRSGSTTDASSSEGREGR